VLVPADPDSLPCGEVCIDEDKYWMVGATPAALSCAAKLALTYVTYEGMLEKNVPQTVEEENMMHAKDAVEKLATNARYAKDYDESKHGAAKMLEATTNAGMSVPLEQGKTTSGLWVGGAWGLAIEGAALSVAAIVASNVKKYNDAKTEQSKATNEIKKKKEDEELAWLPKTPEDYYSRLYAAVFWVILGKNTDPEQKDTFKMLMVCADPEKLKELNTDNVQALVSKGPKLDEKPGFVSQIFSMGATTIMNNPGTALMCVAGVGAAAGAGALGMYAVQNFSVAAAAPYLKQGLEFFKTSDMFRQEREDAITQREYDMGHGANQAITTGRFRWLQSKIIKYEDIRKRMLQYRQNNMLTAQRKNSLVNAEYKIAKLKPQLENLKRIMSPATQTAYDRRGLGLNRDQFWDAAAAAENANDPETQGSALIRSALFDEKWASQRQQVWNVLTRHASKFF